MQYNDNETSLFWLSSRYYSPELGRFIQPADVSTINLSSINGLNLYIYCYNNPVSKTKLISRTLTTTSPYSNAINLTPSFNIASLTISTINNNFIKIINENLKNIVDNLKIKKIIEIFTYVLNIEKSIITGFPIKFFAEKVKVKKSHIKKEEYKIEKFCQGDCV